MLVTFYSNAYENITYLGDVAKQLIVLMGHSGAIPSAIKAKDLPKALNLLESALKKTVGSSEEQDDEVPPDISLAKRAVPLINLLQYSIKNNSDVLWK